MKYRKSSFNPEEAIRKVAPPQQLPSLKMFQPGFDKYFNLIPAMIPDEEVSLNEQKKIAGIAIHHAANAVAKAPWKDMIKVQENQFKRVIIGIEEPTPYYPSSSQTFYKSGPELIVSIWGKGKEAQPHGHAAGYIHEEIIEGEMLVTTYKMWDKVSRIVRPIESFIAKKGSFSATLVVGDTNVHLESPYMVHSLKALTKVVSIHFITEHSKDGVGNVFLVQNFATFWGVDKLNQSLIPIKKEEIPQLGVGQIILVKSPTASEYGVHYCIVTSSTTHSVIPATDVILPEWYPSTGEPQYFLLDTTATKAFYLFHAITITGVGDSLKVNLQTPDL